MKLSENSGDSVTIWTGDINNINSEGDYESGLQTK